MNILSRKFARQDGVTVIEIMIAVALSLIILAGVMHIFMNNKKTYRVQEAFARLQENGRFAMQFLTEDIRMAGYSGCVGMVPDREIVNNVDMEGTKNDADLVTEFTGDGLEGFEYSDLPIALSATKNLTTTNVVNGSDIIRIKGGRPTGAVVTPPSSQSKKELPPDPPNSASLHLDPATAAGLFTDKDILLISNCKHADIFAVTNVNATTTSSESFTVLTHSATENISPLMSKPYGGDAEILRFTSNAYYLGYNGAGIPSLYRQSLGNSAAINEEELVEGVESMEILYGEDTDGDGAPNIYVNANAVTKMSDVVSIRITLGLISVSDNITPKPTNEGDRRLRRDFTTSITIRNRVT